MAFFPVEVVSDLAGQASHACGPTVALNLRGE
jgi:hypothetical protein